MVEPRQPRTGWDVRAGGQRELKTKEGAGIKPRQCQTGQKALKAGEKPKFLSWFIHLFVLKFMSL